MTSTTTVEVQFVVVRFTMSRGEPRRKATKPMSMAKAQHLCAVNRRHWDRNGKPEGLCPLVRRA